MVQEAILELENVTKTYDMGKAGKLTVLKELNLKINEGDFVAITGPSGSGKSTMMNIVGALDVPTSGAVYLKDKNVARMRQSALAEMRAKTIGSGYIGLLAGGSSTGGGFASRMFSQTALSPELLLFAFGFSILIGMIAGVVPAYRASRLKPVDALRYE